MRGRDSTGSDAGYGEDAEEVFREVVAGVGAVSVDQLLAHFDDGQPDCARLSISKHATSEPPLPSPLSPTGLVDLLILDLRPASAFAKGHLPGAVNVSLPPIFSKRIKRQPRATKFSLDSFVVSGKATLDAWRERIRDDPDARSPTVLIIDEDMSEQTLDNDGWTVAMLLLRNLGGSTALSRTPKDLPLSRVGSDSPERGPSRVSSDGLPTVSITRSFTPTTERISFLYLHPGFSALLSHPRSGAILRQGEEPEKEPETPLSGQTIFANPSPILSAASFTSDLERSASLSSARSGKPSGSLLTINTSDKPRRSNSTRSSALRRARLDASPATLGSRSVVSSEASSVLGSRESVTPATLHGTPSTDPSESAPTSPSSHLATRSGSPSPSSDEGGHPPPPITRVLANLYIGTEDMCTPPGLSSLVQLGITHVLNVAIECEDGECDGVVSKKIGVRDESSADVGVGLREGVAWIGGFCESL